MGPVGAGGPGRRWPLAAWTPALCRPAVAPGGHEPGQVSAASGPRRKQERLPGWSAPCSDPRASARGRPGQPGAGQLGTRRRSPSHSLPTRSMRRAAWGRGSHSLAHCRGCRHRAGPRRQTGRARRTPGSLTTRGCPSPGVGAQTHRATALRPAAPGQAGVAPAPPRDGRHSAGVTNVTPPCAVSGRRLLMAQTPAFTGPLPPSVRSPLG